MLAVEHEAEIVFPFPARKQSCRVIESFRPDGPGQHQQTIFPDSGNRGRPSGAMSAIPRETPETIAETVHERVS